MVNISYGKESDKNRSLVSMPLQDVAVVTSQSTWRTTGVTVNTIRGCYVGLADLFAVVGDKKRSAIDKRTGRPLGGNRDCLRREKWPTVGRAPEVKRSRPAY